MATRLRQTLRDFEEAFHEESEAGRQHREEVVRRAQARTHTRLLEKQHKRGTLRFTLLVLLLIGVAVAVTIAMFETLYVVMG